LFEDGVDLWSIDGEQLAEVTRLLQMSAGELK
jgi:hypothetical protein